MNTSLANAIEESFYLFFPLLCLALGKVIVPVLISFIAIGPFARVAFSANEIWADKSSLSCLDAISIGCLAALLVQHVRWRPLFTQLAGTAMVLLVMVFRRQTGVSSASTGAASTSRCSRWERDCFQSRSRSGGCRRGAVCAAAILWAQQL